jgi:hypothetical protein
MIAFSTTVIMSAYIRSFHVLTLLIRLLWEWERHRWSRCSNQWVSVWRGQHTACWWQRSQRRWALSSGTAFIDYSCEMFIAYLLKALERLLSETNVLNVEKLQLVSLNCSTRVSTGPHAHYQPLYAVFVCTQINECSNNDWQIGFVT